MSAPADAAINAGDVQSTEQRPVLRVPLKGPRRRQGVVQEQLQPQVDSVAWDRGPDAWKQIYADKGTNPYDYWVNSPPPSPPPECDEAFDERLLLFQPEENPAGKPTFSQPKLWISFFNECLNLEKDMAAQRKHMRSPHSVRGRFYLGCHPSPPRPKLPVNDAFRRWMEPVTRDGERDPLTGEIPDQEGDAEEWFEAMRRWHTSALKWLILRKNEDLYIRLFSKTHQDAGMQDYPKSDALEDVVPLRLPPEVYAADPTAPPLMRYHRWWKFAEVFSPEGYNFKDLLIVSNADYIPPLPPITNPVIRIDGRFGVQEESRFPDWHVPGRWHMAFIPTETHGLVHKMEHSSIHRNMMFYVPDFNRDFRSFDGGRSFALTDAFKKALQSAWDAVLKMRADMEIPASRRMHQPYEAEQRGRIAMRFLFSQHLSARHIHETLAAWQRAVAEMMGWNNYMRSLVYLTKWSLQSRNRILPVPCDLRLEHHRKHFRGVFTDNEAVANHYAQFGVPVWLVRPRNDLGNVWCPGGNADKVDITPFVCEMRVYNEMEYSQPAYLQSTYETRSHPTNYFDSRDDDDYVGHQNDIDYRSSAAPAWTANLPENPRKRAGQANAEEPASKKAKAGKNRPAALNLPRFPVERSAGYPSWWPSQWSIALDIVSSINRNAARVRELKVDPIHPVPEVAHLMGRYASPVVTHFAGEINPKSVPGNITKLFASYVMLRPRLLFALGRSPPAEFATFTSVEWKEILNDHIPLKNQVVFAKQLGIDVAPPAEVVHANDAAFEIGHTDRIPASLALQPVVDNPSANSAASTATSPVSLASELPPSTAPTSRAPSPSTGVVSDDDIDMTPVHGSIAPTVPYFVPHDSEIDPPLAREEQRYLYEPSAWRFTARGRKRAQKDLTWFVESERSAGEPLQFVIAGSEKRKDFFEDNEDADVWWDYERAWALIFAESPADSEGSCFGQRLTQPLRVFMWDGQRSLSRAKYLHGTQDGKTLQLRLWHSQSWDSPVHVPREPLGPVGCLSARRWDLDDVDYRFFFPNAPRHLPIPLPEQLAPPRNSNPPPETSLAPVAPPGSAQSQQLVAVTTAGASSAAATTSSSGASLASSAAATISSSGASLAPTRSAAAAVSFPTSLASLWPLRDALAPQRIMTFNDKALTPYEPPEDAESSRQYRWPTDQERALIVWDLSELSFRLELALLDNRLRMLYRDDVKLNGQSNIERQNMLFKVWGSSSFVPTTASPLTAPEWTLRIESILAFYALVSTWPRSSITPPPDVFASEAQFLAFEKEVWRTYAQTQLDYCFRQAAVPLEHPQLPDVEMS